MTCCHREHSNCHFVTGCEDGCDIQRAAEQFFHSRTTAVKTEISISNILLLKRNTVVIKRLRIPFNSGHTGKRITLRAPDHRNSPMSFMNEILGCLISCRSIIHFDIGHTRMIRLRGDEDHRDHRRFKNFIVLILKQLTCEDNAVNLLLPQHLQTLERPLPVLVRVAHHNTVVMIVCELFNPMKQCR
ncbi:hypothetical protein D3C71_1280770 [compost metagenome]